MQSAKALSTITRTDPQMALPQFPKLAEDLHPIWVNSEMMLIIGGANEVIMRGQSVKRLLPRLFAYLNGQYTLDDIVFHLAEFSEDTIHDALAILYMRGVIINGCPDVVV
ncbi:MAG: hypothetical protein KJ043_23565, partial [Anaerolineae bacterium]|nr:hypothetical protein [Anaerolineae bacterium]